LEAARISTAAQPLRDRLRQLEIATGGLRRRNIDVEALLMQRDALEAELSVAHEQDLDVRAERARTETIDGLLRKHTRRLMRLLAPHGGFAGARARHAPPPERWWWYLDLGWRQQKLRSLKRTAIVVVSIGAVLLIANAVLTRFIGPSPEQSAFMERTDAAEQFLQRGLLGEASRAYEQALEIIPTDVEARSRLGVLYELLGRTQAANEAFAIAEQHSPSRDLFLFDQARAFLMLGRPERALTVATAAVTEFDQSAYAYFAYGEALQATGQTLTAAQAFDISALLATEQDLTVLVALARERQAMLLGGAQ